VKSMFLISFRSPSGKIEKVRTPLLDHAGQAFRWIRDQKPWIMSDLDALEIKPYSRGDK
jgi:hypothetical protein